MKTILKEEGFPLALFESYLALINGSIGSHLFRVLYVRTPRGPHDVINNGDLACAYYVSSILTLCNLTQGGVHTTVTETILDLEHSGWRNIITPKPGAVVVWESKLCDDGAYHRHIGFVTSPKKAISNRPNQRHPASHHLTFGLKTSPSFRKIEALYFHDDLLFL